jgi:hypothetical protein
MLANISEVMEMMDDMEAPGSVFASDAADDHASSTAEDIIELQVMNKAPYL